MIANKLDSSCSALAEHAAAGLCCRRSIIESIPGERELKPRWSASMMTDRHSRARIARHAQGVACPLLHANYML